MLDRTADGRPTVQLNIALPVLLVVGGALNGFAVRIIESWQLNGASSLFFGISPFELIALAVAVDQLTRAQTTPYKILIWPEVLLAFSLLVPSSTVSWICIALYAATLTLTSQGTFRRGALLALLLAITALWSSVALRWFALPITTIEAHAIWAGLSLFRSDLSITGNVVGIPGAHQVIILAACSTAYIVPKALLALGAIAAFFDNTSRKIFVPLALALTVLLTLSNWFRLAAMSWSPPMFELAHGPVGANIFDLFLTALILGAGFLLCRR